MPDQSHSDVLRHTADIVSAHLSHNQIEIDTVTQLIRSVYQALSGLSTGLGIDVTSLKPAVPIRKSVFPDYIVCLEDGKRLKMIKRYLRTHFGLTPVAYRERWGLPADYPMVAPNYARTRSVLAYRNGLGRNSAAEQPAGKAVEAEEQLAANKPPKAPNRRKTVVAETKQ